MRAKHILEDKVNVHQRAIKAAERTGTNGQKQPSLHISKTFPTQSDMATLWERLQRLFPSSEVLDVAGRPVKGFVIPHWAAGVLLAAILGSMGVMYNQISSQRDMLIRLDTQLQERDKHELEYRNEFKVKTNVQQLQIDNMTTQLAAIKSMLSPQQIQAIERHSRKEN